MLHASIRLLSLFSHCIISLSSRIRGQSISPTKVNVRVRNDLIIIGFYDPASSYRKHNLCAKSPGDYRTLAQQATDSKIKFKYAQNVWQDFASCPLSFSSPTAFCSFRHILSTCLGCTHSHTRMHCTLDNSTNVSAVTGPGQRPLRLSAHT